MRALFFSASVICGVLVFVPLHAQPANAPAESISVTIDARTTAPPISPYIYGQFIEHIGDLINRSLWAEMLDDRKFYDDVNSKPAPGAAGAEAAAAECPTGGGPSVQMIPW